MKQNPSYNFQNMRNVNSHSTGKVSENRNIKKLWIFYFAWSSNSYNFQNIEYSKGMSFLHISREAEIHTVPKRWDELIPKLQNKYGKHRQIPGPVLPCSFRVDENSCNPRCLEMCKIRITWKYSVKNFIAPKLWVFEEIWDFFPFHEE